MYWDIVLYIVLVSALAIPALESQESGRRCGYESCSRPREGYLNVHIVPHTHDDVGWLKTVDQYYYGNRNDIQKAGVQYILDSVIKELWEDPARRFVYVESAFFSKWWDEQNPSVKSKVHTLVQEGRLKFAGGGWSMNDEATTYYQSTIDQFTFGLSFLNATFGECGRPRVGWQIDPFGHSREFASFLAASGFDGLFLGRIDYRDKSSRLQEKSMEFLWRGDDNLGKSSDIFTGVLYNTYSPPPGFCFDVLCNDEPIIDDPTSPDYNVDRRVSSFFDFVTTQHRYYLTDNVIVTMGGDFTYQDAGMWYKNLDKLIKYGNKKAENENIKINLFYSTPDCYLKAVKDADPILPVKQDDFFPYASDPHSYWTGYFTSRPAIKFLEAEANRYTQMVKQLIVLTDLSNDFTPVLNDLKSAMGILQHHDAITGTEKQHVTADYVRIISKALMDAHDTITTKALNKAIAAKTSVKLDFDRCQFNESSCHTSENAKGNLIVTVYNPLAWSVVTSISVPTLGEEYEVKDSKGKWRKIQSSAIFEAIIDIPTRQSKATHESTFIADLPPLGYKMFYLKRVTKSKRDIEADDGIMYSRGDEMMRWKRENRVVERYPYDDEVGDEGLTSGVDASTGSLKSVLHNDKVYTLKGNAAYYKGYVGNNEIFENRSSGAYIFRPKSNDAVKLKLENYNIVDGDSFMETRLMLSDNAGFSFRTYKDERMRYGEIDWVVGPIDIVDNVGKEYVFQFNSNIVSNGEIYTDSNGRQILKRKLNKRPQYNLTAEEPVAGNYYPIVDYAYIEDRNSEFTFKILPDRPQGVASLQEGGIEVMLHRRLLHDDAFGVGEPLNETVDGVGLAVRGTHRIFFGTTDVTFKDAIEMRNKPQVFVTNAKDLKDDDIENLNNDNSWLKHKSSLPDGVHLLTLEPWMDNTILVRFENYLDKSEKSTKVVDLSDVFKGINVRSVKETVLTGDKLVSGDDKWVWRTKNEFYDDFNKVYGSFDGKTVAEDHQKGNDDGLRISLDAKQIRTFIVSYDYLH